MMPMDKNEMDDGDGVADGQDPLSSSVASASPDIYGLSLLDIDIPTLARPPSKPRPGHVPL